MLSAQRDALVHAARDTSDAALKAQAETRAALLDRVLRAPSEFRVQVVLGEIVDADGARKLVQTTWRTGMDYFYPASAIKLCGAVAAFERLNELARTTAPGADMDTPLAFHGLKAKDKLEDVDASNLAGGKPTVAQLVRRVGLVSDNEAFNRLYDFAGQNWLNERMWRAGLTSVRVQHRLSVRQSPNDSKRTPIVELRLPTGALLIEGRWGSLDLGLGPAGYRNIYIGAKHIGDDATIVDQGMSFFDKNAITLCDLQRCLVRVVRPEIALAGEPFDLTDAQRALLLDALSCYPGDSANPKYERERYPDAYAKFFLPGVERAVPKGSATIYNKVGLAYGFAIDNACIVDKAGGRTLFLAATVFANSDGVMNDDKYDYESVGLPFLEGLAEAVVRDAWVAK